MDNIITYVFYGIFLLMLGTLLFKKNKHTDKPEDVNEPLPHIMSQKEINEIDDSIDIDKFMKDIYRIYKEYEEAKQNFDYDKLELLLGHDLKILTIEKIQEYEREDKQVIYKNFSCHGGGISHIYKYGPIEKINVILHVNRTVYTIDRTTHNVIKGDKNLIESITYRLTFEKSKNGFPSNCPQCGGTFTPNDECKCAFCGSIVNNTYGDYKLIFKEIIRREEEK